MYISYQTPKDDLVQAQLFMSSISTQHIKARKRQRWRIPVLNSVFGLLLVFDFNEYVVSSIFFAVGAIWYLAYPRYSKWIYTRYFSKHIEQNMLKRTESPIELHFADDHVSCIDYAGESKLKFSSIERIDETLRYCFLKFDNGLCEIIPLYQLENTAAIIDYLKTLSTTHGIPYQFHPDWK